MCCLNLRFTYLLTYSYTIRLLRYDTWTRKRSIQLYLAHYRGGGITAWSAHSADCQLTADVVTWSVSCPHPSRPVEHLRCWRETRATWLSALIHESTPASCDSWELSTPGPITAHNITSHFSLIITPDIRYVQHLKTVPRTQQFGDYTIIQFLTLMFWNLSAEHIDTLS